MKDIDLIIIYENYIKQCVEENKESQAKMDENNGQIEKYRQYCRELKGRETA